MAEIKETVKNVQKSESPKGESKPHVKNVIRMRQSKRRSSKSRRREDDEFDTKIVSIRRVAKVGAGSKRLRMSVLVAVGDKKGRVGVGLGRGDDVRSAIEKAIKKAKKNVFFVSMKDNTIPHEVTEKFGAAKVLIKPASPGTGIIAGSAVRAVVELAGIKDVLSKVIGTNNKVTNVYCTINALKRLKGARV